MVRPKNPKNFFDLLLIIFLALGLARLANVLLRKDYAFYPAIGDTFDEYKAPFNGLSLIKKGYPQSWSWYQHYGEFPVIEINDSPFRLVKPWFDEPALFSLMAGAESLRFGMEEPWQVDITKLRHSMVKVGTINVILLFFLVLFNSGLLPAITSGLIYATVPTFVLSQRLPVSDAMLATFTLISMLFLTLYFQRKNFLYCLISLIFASSALHLKSTGVFVPVAISALLFSQKKYRPFFLSLFLTTISLGAWFYYGYHFGWEIFLKTLEVSSGRELFSPTIIINLFHTFRIGEKVMGVDGWILWGWISVVVSSFFFKKKNPTFANLVLPITLICYLTFFSIMSGHIKGWYRLPFYPFLSWASALLIIKILQKPQPLAILFFLGLAFFSSFIYGHGGIRWSNLQIKQYQFALVSFMAIPLLYQLLPHPFLKRASQFLFLAAFIASIVYNYRTITLFQSFFYYHSL
jgi:4-amino-4-deoxy-L-arabinose transferase-like glycosyltransferase